MTLERCSGQGSGISKKPGQLVAEGLPWGAPGLVRLSLISHCLSPCSGSFCNQKEQLCKISQLWMEENLEGITRLVQSESLQPGLEGLVSSCSRYTRRENGWERRPLSVETLHGRGGKRDPSGSFEP